jgi:hypothetical protein
LFLTLNQKSTEMKTTSYLAACALTTLATMPAPRLMAEVETESRADSAPATEDASAIAISGGDGKITIRLEKDGKSVTRVIELDGDDPAKAGAIIAEAIRDGDRKGADRAEGSRTFLGVMLDESAGDAAKNLPVEKGVGLRVNGVSKESPAARAGLKENDILVRLDDQILVTPQQLIVLVRNRKPGDTVRLTYYRDGGKHEVEATLGEANPDQLGEEFPAKPDSMKRLFKDLKDGGKRQLLRSRLLRVDPDGKVTEEKVAEEDGDDDAIKKWPLPFGNWQRESGDTYKKLADDYSRAQGELAGKLKEEFGRLRGESEKLQSQFRDAQKELVEKLGAEVKKAQAAAREAQRAAERALAELKEREAAGKVDKEGGREREEKAEKAEPAETPRKE